MTQFRSPLRLIIAAAALCSLAACNNNDPTLGVGQQGAQPAAAQAVQQTGLVAVQPGPAAATAGARLYIAPIIGSTVAAITPLSRRLGTAAGAGGLALVGEADPTRTHVVKGYFSVLPENGATTIIFVWDVFDPRGTRLHRIQGQESVPGTAADPWSIVPPATMERIADRLIADFRAWQAGQAVAAPAVPAASQPMLAPAAPAPVPVVAPAPAPAATPAAPAQSG